MLRAVIEFLIAGSVSAMEIYRGNRGGKFENIFSRITIRVYKAGSRRRGNYIKTAHDYASLVKNCTLPIEHRSRLGGERSLSE